MSIHSRTHDARRWISGACLALCLLPAAARAQETQQDDPVAAMRREIDELKRAYEERISALEKRLADLEPPQGEAPAPPAPPVETAPPEVAEAAPPPEAPPAEPAVAAGSPTEPASGGGAAQTSNYFNPGISVIGNFLLAGGQNPVEDLPAANLRESEVGLQAIIDPYARADFFIAFGDEGAEVEEGFATFTALPAGLLVKAGRMRTAFGKINPLHLHVLPWADEPLPIVNLLGGEEGWVGDGVSVARLFPVGDVFTEGTLQIFRGEADGLFEGERRGDLSYNGHYRVFMDLTEASNLDAGLSYGFGPNGTTESADTRLEGLDLTYRWKPLQTGSYRSASLRGEVFRSLREQPEGDQTAIGWYVSGDYQLARRWFVGARYEAADHADDDSLRDTGEAGTLTFWPSEFSQLRAELRRRHYSLTDETANELLLQLQFAIGAHGAHPF
ncbi:MAG: hypothetical protein ACJ759_08140 [Thermoanaerobaculia bacterium]